MVLVLMHQIACNKCKLKEVGSSKGWAVGEGPPQNPANAY